MATNDEIANEYEFSNIQEEVFDILYGWTPDYDGVRAETWEKLNKIIKLIDSKARADEREQINKSHIATVTELVKQRDYYAEKYDKGKDNSTYQIYLKERYAREESIRQAERQRCIKVFKKLIESAIIKGIEEERLNTRC